MRRFWLFSISRQPKVSGKKFPQNAISSTLLNTKAPVSLSSLHSGRGGGEGESGRINGYHSLATSSRNCFYVRAGRARGVGKKQEGRRGKILACIARARDIHGRKVFANKRMFRGAEGATLSNNRVSTWHFPRYTGETNYRMRQMRQPLLAVVVLFKKIDHWHRGFLQ